MSYELLVGLHILDDEKYTEYRKAMLPLLRKVAGGFRYDFRVSETLINDEGRPINRLFVIYFGSKAQKDLFFNDPDYLTIKQRYFEESVGATTIISEYQR